MRHLLTVLVLAACGGAAAGDPDREAAQHDSVAADTATVDPHAMPEPPAGASGRLVIVAPADSALQGSWTARAGRCETSGRVHILSDDVDYGVAVLFALPDSAPLERRYPVLPADSAPPAPPTARIGIHRFEDRVVSAYQAVGGEAALTVLDRTVSGSFRARLHELSTREQVLVAGTFLDLRLRPLPEMQCRGFGELPDSTASPDTAGSVKAGEPVTLSRHGFD